MNNDYFFFSGVYALCLLGRELLVLCLFRELAFAFVDLLCVSHCFSHVPALHSAQRGCPCHLTPCSRGRPSCRILLHLLVFSLPDLPDLPAGVVSFCSLPCIIQSEEARSAKDSFRVGRALEQLLALNAEERCCRWFLLFLLSVCCSGGPRT